MMIYIKIKVLSRKVATNKSLSAAQAALRCPIDFASTYISFYIFCLSKIENHFKIGKILTFV